MDDESAFESGGPDDIDANDDQSIAESFDEDNVEAELDLNDYGPDHGLAVDEARVVLDNGDVPADSLEERLWREEPDGQPLARRDWNEELIERSPDFGLDPDFADESVAEVAHATPEGSAVADVGGAFDEMLPAEEAAMHVVGGDDE